MQRLPDGNFTRNAQDIYPWYEFEKFYWFKITAAYPKGRWVDENINEYLYPSKIGVMTAKLPQTKHTTSDVVWYKSMDLSLA